MISDRAGEYLVILAKETIKYYLENGKTMVKPTDYPIELDENLGVFVTLNKNNNLRGCIGYAEPVKPAIDAAMEVALSAAFNDPRFPEVSVKEFEDLDFEVTILTKPELIEVAHYQQYFDEIEIGRDGLIIQKGYARGLLLPQVAVENAFTIEDFLDHTCMKAGISADSWMDESCDVFRFQGQIFK
ncbi:MAG: TIGR00296 family protein [Methanobrevibacter sp.]|uniref:TIGR00296 family protein n=2 Tax=Methanobrevibacter sp. TaxID=66852 RepID=UPI001B571B4F|nr:TIGR00296 family protein [Methanobrevibacter sp.]MBP3791822.1 TIGR00296 family protein [Methanobrevibacter sp.]